MTQVKHSVRKIGGYTMLYLYQLISLAQSSSPTKPPKSPHQGIQRRRFWASQASTRRGPEAAAGDRREVVVRGEVFRSWFGFVGARSPVAGRPIVNAVQTQQNCHGAFTQPFWVLLGGQSSAGTKVRAIPTKVLIYTCTYTLEDSHAGGTQLQVTSRELRYEWLVVWSYSIL